MIGGLLGSHGPGPGVALGMTHPEQYATLAQGLTRAAPCSGPVISVGSIVGGCAVVAGGVCDVLGDSPPHALSTRLIMTSNSAVAARRVRPLTTLTTAPDDGRRQHCRDPLLPLTGTEHRRTVGLTGLG
jgi:hypothetical protein